MMQCNDDASAMITPDVQNDARKMKKVEDAVKQFPSFPFYFVTSLRCQIGLPSLYLPIVRLLPNFRRVLVAPYECQSNDPSLVVLLRFVPLNTIIKPLIREKM